MSKVLAKPLLFFVVVSVFLLDVVSKLLTVKFLNPLGGNDFWYPYGGIGVFKNFFGVDFALVYATNEGAAWSLFSEYQNVLLFVRIVLIFGMVIYAVAYNRNPAYDIPLALIITGAACNVLDYFVYGHVIDMFKFVLWQYHYPIFNVADSAICIGVFLFLLVSWTGQQQNNKG